MFHAQLFEHAFFRIRNEQSIRRGFITDMTQLKH